MAFVDDEPEALLPFLLALTGAAEEELPFEEVEEEEKEEEEEEEEDDDDDDDDEENEEELEGKEDEGATDPLATGDPC